MTTIMMQRKERVKEGKSKGRQWSQCIQEGMTHTHPHTHSNVNNHTPPHTTTTTGTHYTAVIHPHKPFITSYDIMSHHYYTS